MLKKACSVLVLLIFCFTYINVFEFEIISKNTAYAENIDCEEEDTNLIDIKVRDGLYDPKIYDKYVSAQNEDLFLKDYYSPRYFDELNNNFGNNTKGSCGYVATGMLLSFWDTYWDDSIIEENYDVRTKLSKSYIDFPVEAPGVAPEPFSIAYADDETYYQNIFNTQEQYFQFLLMSMGNDLYGIEQGDYGLASSNMLALFKHYLFEYRNFSKNDVEITSTSLNVRNKAIRLIKQGIPVILFIQRDGGAHAVIAYDYDEATDNIYCHFGWGANTTHVTFESMGYTKCYYLFALNFKNNHNHSNNFYHDTEGYNENKCICSTVIPSAMECDGNYLDTLPTYKWNSLIKEKWFKNIKLYHEFQILDSYRHSIYKVSHLFDSKYTLTAEEWKKIIDMAGSNYYVYIGLASDVDPYWDDYYYSELFSEPTEYAFKTQVKPNQWGFEGRYWFENEGIRTSTLSIGDLNISTRRLRCGYIENSYIILSPRRENAGEAYFEMNFDKKVYAFLYSVCLWSNSENLDGIAIIEVKDANGNWSQLVDIKTSNQLKNKSDGLNRYVMQCPNGIYGIRFKCTATATGTRNKGRLCIDDLVFCTNPNNTQFITTGYVKTK